MLYQAKTIEKYKIIGKDGEVGSVKEFYFEDQFWTIRYLVADTGNWLTGRQVLLSPHALERIDDEEESIVINLTEQQIENSPPLASDKPVSHQFERAFFSYYQYPEYWSDAMMWGAAPSQVKAKREERQREEQEEESWDPHLRSTYDVRGHHIEGSDGEIGHVEDFLIDDENWAIRYLMIDTKNWWGGKKVLISLEWVERISWEDQKVFVNLSREKIKQSPEYSEDLLLTRDYEEKLHKHYNRKGYWEE